MDVSIPWPYVVRCSHRARYIRIVLKACQPIEVIYPRWSSKREAMNFLQQKLSWIAKQEDFVDSLSEPGVVNFPEYVVFPCVNREWRIHIQRLDGARVKVSEFADCLQFSGSIDRVEDIRLSFRQWMKRQAERYLEPMLVALSEQVNLPFTSVTWRFQRTRWGSCSDKKRISLNVKLLLLPLSEVRYVLLHELCHTQHMNHGVKFWQLLEAHCPNAKKYERSLYCRHVSEFSWL